MFVNSCTMEKGHYAIRHKKDLRPSIDGLPWEPELQPCQLLDNSQSESNSYQDDIIATDRSDVMGMRMQDVNPGVAIRKVSVLFEKRKYTECAILINRLTNVTLKTIISELAIEVFIDAIPQSLGILEALYSKLFIMDADNFPVDLLQPEHTVLQMVRWIATIDDECNHRYSNYDYYHPMMRNILRIIVYVQPDLRHQLTERRDALRRCLEGLAKHGLVDSCDGKLINLHDALKIELGKLMQQVKNAIQKLEELSLAHRRCHSVHASTAPGQSSHQQRMRISQPDVQERIIKNKSLLNVVEPAIVNSYFSTLVHLLEERIELDKEVLSNYTGLKREMRELPTNCVVVPVFQQFAHGYDRIIGLLLEILRRLEAEGNESGIEGSEDSGQ